MYRSIFVETFILSVVVTTIISYCVYKYAGYSFWKWFYFLLSGALIGGAIAYSLNNPGNDYYYFVCTSIYFLLVSIYLQINKLVELNS